MTTIFKRTAVLLVTTTLLTGFSLEAATPSGAESEVKHPFQSECQGPTDNGGAFQCTITSVPRGKLLVIEMLSGLLQLSPGDRPNNVTVTTKVNGRVANHQFVNFVTGSDASTGVDLVTVSETTRIYADPGSAVIITTVTHTPNGFAHPAGNVDFTISGHLE